MSSTRKTFPSGDAWKFAAAATSSLFARSGNVDNPDRNWSLWKQVDLRKDLPVDAPSARFIQWKAVLHPGKPAAAIESVTLNYLPKNVAPEVEDVAVVVGSRVPAGTHTEPESSHAKSLCRPHSDGPRQAFHCGEVEGAG